MFELLASRRLQLLLTALVHIAATDVPISGKRLAEKLYCPRRYLEADLQALVQRGILESRRGAAGGYVLAANPQRISLLDVLRCLVGEQKPEALNICAVQAEVVAPALQQLGCDLERTLAARTLAQLLAQAEAKGLIRMPQPTPDFCI